VIGKSRRDILFGAVSASAATLSATLLAQKATAQQPTPQSVTQAATQQTASLRILLLNPNSSPDFTKIIAREARRAASPNTELLEVTAPFGPRYVGTRTTNAIAGHAAIDALARILAEEQKIDAGIVTGFGIQGVTAMREFAPFPMTTLLDASVSAALQLGSRFAVLTGGERWVPMLQEQLQAMGLSSRLAAVRAIPLTGAEIAKDQDRALSTLTDLANASVREDGADCIIFGGAAVAGIPARIQNRVSVPLIDNVAVSVATAEMLARVVTKPQVNNPPPAIESIGLSDALTRLLIQP